MTAMPTLPSGSVGKTATNFVKNYKNILNKKNFPTFPVIYHFNFCSKKKVQKLCKFLDFKETKYIHKNMPVLNNLNKIFNFYRILNTKLSFYLKKNKIILFITLIFNYNLKSFTKLICLFFRFNLKIKILRKIKKLSIKIEIFY